jgi:flagellar L-ring protein precursor FlgH
MNEPLRTRLALFITVMMLAAAPFCAHSENLFSDPQWASLASDRRAARVGDILTVVVYQTAEARNAAQNDGAKDRSFQGSITGGTIEETADLSLDGQYSGRGETRRSESFVTQISVRVESVLENGDYGVAGEQVMNVNGEETTIRVRGRVRPADISRGNQVLSTRIADAQIDYDGRGFVSRNARPGLVHRLFSLLGLAG